MNKSEIVGNFDEYHRISLGNSSLQNERKIFTCKLIESSHCSGNHGKIPLDPDSSHVDTENKTNIFKVISISTVYIEIFLFHEPIIKFLYYPTHSSAAYSFLEIIANEFLAFFIAFRARCLVVVISADITTSC